ncbi:unnamed protein product [Pseudo-nitzschia multistriata]|uniref:Uncharacterized protein n=1 Tax=Pseudo-nitzschia multistriata TaxID=183589 RepID=A0A448ZJS0_9STRA|nr:unnamed protein product [Pseudo-nitzschia multistriata]
MIISPVFRVLIRIEFVGLKIVIRREVIITTKGNDPLELFLHGFVGRWDPQINPLVQFKGRNIAPTGSIPVFHMFLPGYLPIDSIINSDLFSLFYVPYRDVINGQTRMKLGPPVFNRHVEPFRVPQPLLIGPNHFGVGIFVVVIDEKVEVSVGA